MKKYILLASLLLFFVQMEAQQAMQNISLSNASFEGEPQDAIVPVGWFACAPLTTPDILPGYWGVYNEPSEGETFMGLITRSNGTWESIGQRLSAPLKTTECYAFSIDLAHSKTYAGYNKPIKVRIWGGRKRCGKDQIIGETEEFIEHSDWETYEFKFTPKKRINYIIIEAHYKDGFFSREGNVLIDNLSVFKICPRA